ncbi:ribonuclease H-like domain-containing protein [Paenibacillus roseipurpureus]|uniref:Ribonuclease H-like domain-containing protein n=1 Tax=Paenibacillus roseopurpureus TaxID=2918901 RepID=A0AA96LKD4_9BACL|nr:ribonuclease H-like domain-containing protein [Paenibacillus sp. MBLB1832]WNR42266.1 ribonuclease H-like domain-containing protein [Paenibacillus sp. MBLB1832]
MSGLRERLGRLRGPAAASATPPPPPEAGGEWAQLGAHIATSPGGSFVMRRRVYGADSVHGKYRLSDLADVAPQLSSFHEHDAVVRAEELLFFDTETTGLGVGAGNVPFMVGIGYYEDEQFIVEQLFIRNPAEEQAMLLYLQALLGRFTHIVSYNGRTFDWPILKNRFVLNRLALEDAELLQLDLLYSARSLWRNSLPSCRLSKVEEARLGFERVDDVPGSMAPALYFLYLAEKDPSVLKGVFVHNEHDIVTLAALAIHFGRLLTPANEDSMDEEYCSDVETDEGGFGAEELHQLDLEELYRTGVWLDKMDRIAKAERYFDRLYTRLLDEVPDRPPADREIAAMQLADWYKKRGRYSRAVELWKTAILLKPSSISSQLEPYLELAMYYEHKEKNLELAVFYTEEAWAKLWRRRALQRADRKFSELEDAWEKRLNRLQDKIRKKKSTHAPKETVKQVAVRTKPNKKLERPSYVAESLI